MKTAQRVRKASIRAGRLKESERNKDDKAKNLKLDKKSSKDLGLNKIFNIKDSNKGKGNLFIC